MRRTLVHLSVAASALICAILGIIAVRSYRQHDTLGWYWRTEAHRTEYRRCIISAQGKVLIQRFDLRALDERKLAEHLPDHFVWRPQYWSGPPQQYQLPSGGLLHGLGFDLVTGKYDVTVSGPHGDEPAKQTTVTRNDSVTVPYWLLVGLFGAVPVWRGVRWAVRAPRERRRRRGLCVQCGYDLRASESGKCPECGMPTGPPARSA
jgi:hypothetical protein